MPRAPHPCTRSLYRREPVPLRAAPLAFVAEAALLDAVFPTVRTGDTSSRLAH
ncbi:hypothetical protein [Nannocystis radixulma]|uniref:Uncharacterized protein n=1 Tax=Nannocystis radixulma TaxID=2995305 RepID=A0ABT5BF28_9BACT|nr:hypothetical protein [Nannocystis radixulma]MDC0672119.1 hypothetical protein [Nannocystis radixulma]